MLENARQLAIKLHGSQLRKSNGLSYFDSHLAECESIAACHGANLVIRKACYLHDSLEDQEATNEVELEELGVLDAVKQLTENKQLRWEERKQEVIHHIPSISYDAAFTKACDVLSNLRGLLRDGSGYPQIWDAFKRGREKSLWFYEGCVINLSQRGDLPVGLIAELRMTFDYVNNHI